MFGSLEKVNISLKLFINFALEFIILSFMRYTLYVLSFLFFAATHSLAAGASLESRELKRYADMPTERLSALGVHYLNERQKPDSALVCYTIIADRYRNKEGSKAEMRCYALALNNLGYLYGGYYLDFEHAYDYLLQAVVASKKYHINDNLAYAYLNLAAIYFNRSGLLGISDNDHQILKYSRMAFDDAIRQKQWNVASASFFNLFSFLCDSGSIGEIQDEVRRFLSIPALKHDPLSKFVFDDYQGTLAFKAGNYEKSLIWFQKQFRDAENVKMVTVSCKRFGISMRFIIRKSNGMRRRLSCSNSTAMHRNIMMLQHITEYFATGPICIVNRERALWQTAMIICISSPKTAC